MIGAVRHVSLNPVRAGLTPDAEDWAWSSARAHHAGVDDDLVTVRPVPGQGDIPPRMACAVSAACERLRTLGQFRNEMLKPVTAFVVATD